MHSTCISRAKFLSTLALLAAGCSDPGGAAEEGSGGSSSQGGTATGGTGSGGTSAGGSSVSGGSSSGGGSSGGNGGSGGSGAGNSSAGDGGSGGTASGGTTGNGEPGVACSEATAPSLEPGVWTNISPPVFAEDSASSPFTQGFAFDPNNPCVLYVCIQNFSVNATAGLYKSTDAGSSWNKIGILDEPMHVRIDPNDSEHLYAVDGVRGGTMGFWVSTDGGENWSKPQGWTDALEFWHDDSYDIAVEPGNFDHVLVTSHSWWDLDVGAGILESTDGGDSWKVHLPQGGVWGAGHSVWFMNDSDTWLLGTQDGGFWRTTNAGDDWTQVSEQSIAHGGSQLYQASNGTWYAGTGWHIIRSTDDGASWDYVGDESFTTAIYGDGKYLYAHQAYGAGAHAYVVSLETDGVTWEPFGDGTQMFDNGPYEMAFDAADGILYSAAWGNGLLALKVAE